MGVSSSATLRLNIWKRLLENVGLWDRETQVAGWVVAAAQVLEWAVQRDITQMAKEVMLLPGASQVSQVFLALLVVNV